MAGTGIFNGYSTEFPGQDVRDQPCHAEYKFTDLRQFKLGCGKDCIPNGCLIVVDLYGSGQYHLVAATARGYIAVFSHNSRDPVHTFNEGRLGSVLFLTSTKIDGRPVLIAISAEAGFHVLTAFPDVKELHLQMSHRIPSNSVWCVLPVFLDSEASTSHFLLGCMDRSVYLYSLTENSMHCETQYRIGAMVYNLALHRPNRDDPPLILVGVQGRYAFIDPMSKQQPVTRDIQDPDHSTFMFDVVGGVKGRDDKADGYYAVSPQNGTIVVCSLSFDTSKKRTSLLHSIRVGQVFKVQTGRMLLSGLSCHTFMDEAVQLAACTWGGVFFLIDMRGRTVGVNILKRVRTWASGPFTLNANGDTQNCLFYHSFDDEIFCYYNIEHFSMPGETLTDMVDLTEYPNIAPALGPLRDPPASAALMGRQPAPVAHRSHGDPDTAAGADEGPGPAILSVAFPTATVPLVEKEARATGPLELVLNAGAAGAPLVLVPFAPHIVFAPERVLVQPGSRVSTPLQVSARAAARVGHCRVSVHVLATPGNSNALPPEPLALQLNVTPSRVVAHTKRELLQCLLHLPHAHVRALEGYREQLHVRLNEQYGAMFIQQAFRKWRDRRARARAGSVGGLPAARDCDGATPDAAGRAHGANGGTEGASAPT